MHIRKAKIEDLNQLTDILNQSIRWGKATAFLKELSTDQRIEWFTNHQDEPYQIFVVEDNNLVIAYLSLGPYREGREAFRHVAEISYFVHFDHHKKGIGSKLIDFAIAYCKEQQIDTLLAFLYATNEPSIKLLKKFGFELWGLFPDLIHRENMKVDHSIYGLILKD